METNRSSSSVLLRVSAVIFAVVVLAVFVWYSQVRAQRPKGLVVEEKAAATQEKSPIVLSGSKSFSGPVVRAPVMAGSKSGVLTLQPVADPAKASQKPMAKPASAQQHATQPVATPLDPATKQRVLMDGSKAPAGPVNR